MVYYFPTWMVDFDGKWSIYQPHGSYEYIYIYVNMNIYIYTQTPCFITPQQLGVPKSPHKAQQFFSGSTCCQLRLRWKSQLRLDLLKVMGMRLLTHIHRSVSHGILAAVLLESWEYVSVFGCFLGEFKDVFPLLSGEKSIKKTLFFDYIYIIKIRWDPVASWSLWSPAFL